MGRKNNNMFKVENKSDYARAFRGRMAWAYAGRRARAPDITLGKPRKKPVRGKLAKVFEEELMSEIRKRKRRRRR